MIEVIGVRFKKAGKIYYFGPNGIEIKKGQNVIVFDGFRPYFEIQWAPSRVRRFSALPAYRLHHDCNNACGETKAH